MKNKVFLSVLESDICYRFQELNFYFSSEARKERFEKNYQEFIKEEKTKFINKYNVRIDESFDFMFAFIFYEKCEKRGFKVEAIKKGVPKAITTYYQKPIFSVYGILTND